MSQSPRALNFRINTCSRNVSSCVLPALSISVLALLSGCGALTDVRSFSTPYSTPDGGETARLRVISDGMVRGVPKSDCVDFRLPGAGVMVAFRMATPIATEKAWACRRPASAHLPRL